MIMMNHHVANYFHKCLKVNIFIIENTLILDNLPLNKLYTDYPCGFMLLLPFK